MKLADLYEALTSDQIEDAQDLSEWVEGEMNDAVKDLVRMGLPYSEEDGDEFPFWVQLMYYDKGITIETVQVNVNGNALLAMVDTDDEELKAKMQKRLGKKQIDIQNTIKTKYEDILKTIEIKLKKMGATGYIEKSGTKHDLDWVPAGQKTFRVIF